MFTLILVPLDGSPLAAGALPYAVTLARQSGARLLLVRASLVRLPPPPDTYEARLVADEGAYLERTAGLLREQGVDVETALRFADPAEAIVEEARARGADLIAMTSRGHGGLGRLVFGSVATAVVERAPAPVLLLTREADTERDGAPFDVAPRVLVPLDGSPAAEAALPAAKDLATTLGSGLVLLRVIPAHAPVPLVTREPGRESSSAVAAARGYLRRIADQLPPAVQPVELDVRAGKPADAIVAAARGHRAALVVMATRDYGDALSLFNSVAAAVLREADLPLVLVRPASVDRTR